MKIDLHIHTKKILDKDKSNRDINSSDFCEIMNEANVGIASITNHNFFDFNQYEEIMKIIKDKQQQLLLIPGIEIDIILECNNRKQMNILFSPNDMNDFKKFYENFSNKFQLINSNEAEYNGIPFSELKDYILEKCNNNEIILYIDSKTLIHNSKNKSTSFSDNEIQTYLAELNKAINICIIRDTNNDRKYEFLICGNNDSLIGSDNSDWESYVEKSIKLLEYNKLIENFSSLFLIFKNGESYETFDKMKVCKTFDEIKIINLLSDKNTSFFVKNLKIIEKSMNVIFGPKSSGKTDLLNSIQIKFKEKYKTGFYISKEGTDFLNQYENKDYFKEEKRLFLDVFETLLNYNEDRKNFSNFYNWSIQEGRCIFPLAEKEPKLLKNEDKIIKDIEDATKNLYKALDKMKGFSYKSFSMNKDCESLEEIIKNNIDILINLKKDVFMYKVNKEIQLGLSEIVKLWKNKITKHTNIGLTNKFKTRKKLLENITFISEFFNKNIFEELKKYEIPTDDNKIKFITLQYKLIFKFHEKSTSEYAKSIKKLIKNYCHNGNFTNPLKILQKLKEEIENKNDYHFVKKQNHGNFIFLENNEIINISKGEKYYLNLMSFLESDLDYYFLDEPETSLNNNFISTIVYKRFIDLIKENGKTFVITTHNSILGINTKSMNYIFRDNKNIDSNNNYETLIGNIQEKFLINTATNQRTAISINEKLFECFEGDKEKYKYRGMVYNIT